MNVSSYVAPVTRNLKANSSNINFVLLVLVLFYMLPLDQLLRMSVQRDTENSFRNLVRNPLVMLALTIVVYSTYLTGDMYMLVLGLFLLHRFTMH